MREVADPDIEQVVGRAYSCCYCDYPKLHPNPQPPTKG